MRNTEFTISSKSAKVLTKSYCTLAAKIEDKHHYVVLWIILCLMNVIQRECDSTVHWINLCLMNVIPSKKLYRLTFLLYTVSKPRKN